MRRSFRNAARDPRKGCFAGVAAEGSARRGWRRLDGGILISNPIPSESAIDNDYINKFIDQAILDAKANNISGKDTTPFLLKAITDATNNKSLQANIALIYNNAKVGANIAKEYCKVK